MTERKVRNEYAYDIKNLKIERDNAKAKAEQFEINNKRDRTAIYNLANEALERLESMWFKPSHAISLVMEIVNKTR